MREGHREASFVLRIWSDGERVWRYSLEPLRGGEKRSFARLEELLAAIEREKEEACATESASQP
ncbi:MAG: hypothetical protein RMK51_12225 [Meiothermus sp.]|uniref:hypothetical protein n=1 Tax=Meiothermus sp. TaxID=1955249 RepID=UPI0025E72B64|nr:hypothetical protein [Meiothermus sp.]MCS7069761.1 hypothetical protein [Meiothermus sp.]MDW8426692.1 hypothetical protein [Meiothermus sp.]